MAQRRVICVGNELCSDDGVALSVANILESHADVPKDVEILRAPEFGLSCLDAFLGASHVVVVDAVARGGRPGTCSVLDDPVRLPRMTCSVGHATTLPAMLELVAHLDDDARLPTVTLVGIEVESLAPFCTTLSPLVLAAIPEAVDLVLSILQNSPAQT